MNCPWIFTAPHLSATYCLPYQHKDMLDYRCDDTDIICSSGESRRWKRQIITHKRESSTDYFNNGTELWDGMIYLASIKFRIVSYFLILESAIVEDANAMSIRNNQKYLSESKWRGVIVVIELELGYWCCAGTQWVCRRIFWLKNIVIQERLVSCQVNHIWTREVGRLIEKDICGCRCYAELCVIRGVAGRRESSIWSGPII
jgi:hypothetical protein